MKNLPLLAALSFAVTGCAIARPVPGPVSAVRHIVKDDVDLVDEIVTLKTRGDARQSFLLATRRGAQPKVVALMFPGGAGLIGLPADANQLTRGSMFVMRTRDLFRDRETAVAVIDAPSDHQGGLDDDFRSGREHAQDIAAVVEDLKRRFPSARLFLVGTSRGTVSVAHLGRALGLAVDGVVLASTVFSGSRRDAGLRDFDFRTIGVPLLFVHHEKDGCWACPYAAVRELGKVYPLITVKGGSPAQSGECEPLSAHGYFGKEVETVAAVKNWMLRRAYPRLVE